MVWLTLVDFHSPVVGMMPDLTNSTLTEYEKRDYIVFSFRYTTRRQQLTV